MNSIVENFKATKTRGISASIPIQHNKRKTIVVRAVIVLALSTVQISNIQAQDAQTQFWQGILDVGPAQLTLNIELSESTTNNSIFAVVYVVEQGNSKIKVDKITRANGKLTLEMDSIHASFAGVFDESAKTCKGTFTQHGHAFDLEIRRVKSFIEEATELIEYWKGTLELEGTELEMGLKVFRSPDGSLTAKLDSYTQGVTDLPVEFEKSANNYTVEFPAANLQFAGTLNDEQEKLTGIIKQGSSENELEFTKSDFAEIPKFNRPQTPTEPFPYESVDVSYENSKQSTRLSGTLTLPAGDGPFPVAITISGSGASDRNESNFEHKPFLIIADHLARRGIAVLRYDDRGVGQSTGDYSKATSADLATDVEAGIDFLKQHSKINTGRIGLIGHSEGGLIAPMIAAERDDVHFIVLLAGTGVNGGEILKSQSTAMMKAAGETDVRLEANRKVHDAILGIVENNPNATHDEIESAAMDFIDSIEDESTRQLMKPTAEKLVAMLKSPWVNYFVKHDPIDTLAKVKCHVLALNGQKDLQVLCDLNLTPIEQVLNQGSPASFKVVRFPNMNHMFQKTSGTGSPGDYGKIEQTFSPDALNVIYDWIKKVID